MNDITSYMLEQAKKILSIDSPTGFTAHAAEYVLGAYKKLGYDAKLTNKGGIFVCVNDGPDQADDPADAPILLEAHMDTLGGMVCSINEKGRLMLSALGGMNPNNAEAENCRVYTRSGKVYSGTFQLKNASIHVNGSYNDTARSYDAMEVVLDEPVESKADTEALGIMTGDIVCFDPRTVVTGSGYLKSRFLDDKLSAAMLLALAKEIKDNNRTLKRKVYLHFTVYEEVGHGASASVPNDAEELISVDMGCVGDGLTCTEREVSICAKDSGGPYNYAVTTALVEAAKSVGAKYAVDVYPHYGSDVEASLRSGWDVRHGDRKSVV